MPVVGGASVKLPRRQFLHLAAGAAALSASPRGAAALDYPTRPVHLIVGFPPGGPTDIVARLIGRWLSERFGQQFIIENRPGAASNVATEFVAKAPTDGYTLLMAVSTNAVKLYTNLNFDFVRDIAPVASIVRAPYLLVVNPAVPAHTVPEFIAYAKANPSKLNVASPGIGSGSHLAGELFKVMASVTMIHVPYHGAAPAITDLLGGQVQAMFEAVPSLVAHVQAGRLRALAVTTATRIDALPDIPPMADFLPGYEASYWAGIGVPKNTSSEIVDKLNRETNVGLADPTLKARLADLGGRPFASSPADFGKFIDAETTKWANVIKTVGIKPE
jgi:tripartite-type tricarboxylate transporter receptor subunit TctC